MKSVISETRQSRVQNTKREEAKLLREDNLINKNPKHKDKLSGLSFFYGLVTKVTYKKTFSIYNIDRK